MGVPFRFEEFETAQSIADTAGPACAGKSAARRAPALNILNQLFPACNFRVKKGGVYL
jgi:hypothetical protein